MKKQIRLYNLFFVPWAIWYLPLLPYFLVYGCLLVLATLAANFVYDSLVLCLSMKWLRLQGKARLWKKSILKIYGIGYASDVAGTMLMVGIQRLCSEILKFRYWESPVASILLVLPGIALAGVLIYFLNRRFSFTKCDLDPAQVHKLSLSLAVFTAPYLLLYGS